MQPERCSSTIAYKIKAKFPISTLDRMIHLPYWDIHFAHHDFKMPDE